MPTTITITVEELAAETGIDLTQHTPQQIAAFPELTGGVRCQPTACPEAVCSSIGGSQPLRTGGTGRDEKRGDHPLCRILDRQRLRRRQE